ncbi:MAG: AMP-binding protein [Acidimicrobiales bacterium]
MTAGRDVWWDDLMAGAEAHCAPEHMEAEDLLYLLDTSGTTAKPKGIMHSTGGYLTQVTDELAKTRSGKIMRRLLKDVVEGGDLGDTTTLADPGVVEEIRRLSVQRPTEQ